MKKGVYGIILGGNCGFKLTELTGSGSIIIFIVGVVLIALSRYLLAGLTSAKKEVRMKNTNFLNLVVDTIIQVNINIFASTLLA